jgi:hypothetical protein
MPFSVHRPVVVDNSIPDGTILMSWDYADLNTSIMLNCTGNGTESSFLNILNVESSITIVSADIALAGLGFGLSGSGSGILNTSVGGVGIRFYVRSDSPNLGSDGNSSAYIRMSGFGSSGTEYAASGVEYPLIGPTTGMAALVLRMMDSRSKVVIPSGICLPEVCRFPARRADKNRLCHQLWSSLGQPSL